MDRRARVKRAASDEAIAAARRDNHKQCNDRLCSGTSGSPKAARSGRKLMRIRKGLLLHVQQKPKVTDAQFAERDREGTNKWGFWPGKACELWMRWMVRVRKEGLLMIRTRPL